MKKIIGILLIITVFIGSTIIFVSASSTDIPGLEEYLTENINNYFLPQGYDIRGFTWIELDDFSVENFKEKQSNIPFVVMLCTMDWNEYHLDDYYEYLETDPKYKMTDEMIRTFYLENESAVRSFVAPWTLYNAKTGELYTFPELMAMSEADLEALDFKTPDFAKFIANVKRELEARGWWKEEYQAKYDILYAHRDDYKNSLDESENFTIDGETYNFATLYYEFNTKNNACDQNITSVNIHSKEFKEVYKDTSDEIKDKYSGMFYAIENNYNSKPYAGGYYGTVFGQKYMQYLIEYIPGLTKEEIKDIQNRTYYELFEVYFNCGVKKEDILIAAEKYNYLAPSWAKFETKLMDEFFNAETKYDAINSFVTSGGIIINVDSLVIENIIFFSLSGNYDDKIDDIERVIATYQDKVTALDVSSKDIKNTIARLSSIKPDTGDNSVLYVIIAAASLTAMSAMVFRRKRKVTE